MEAITAAHHDDVQMIDSTSVRALQQAATAKRGNSRSLPRPVARRLTIKIMRSLMLKGSRSGSA